MHLPHIHFLDNTLPLALTIRSQGEIDFRIINMNGIASRTASVLGLTSALTFFTIIVFIKHRLVPFALTSK